jgi:hypothetical protein
MDMGMSSIKAEILMRVTLLEIKLRVKAFTNGRMVRYTMESGKEERRMGMGSGRVSIKTAT